MINIEEVNNEFFRYVKNFDESNIKIKRKKEHSIRVQNISKIIAQDLKLSNEEINLSMLIGVLHDIGRFEQAKQFNTFNDFKSFDHGDYGAELLEKLLINYIDTDKYNNIIIQAVRNHNKLIIDKTLDSSQQLFAKLIRDADKLDIMDETINLFYKGEEDIISNSDISDYTFDFIKKQQTVASSKNIDVVYLDKIVRTIAFVFDLNFKKSFAIVKEQDYINRIIDRFNYNSEQTKKRMEEIREIVNKYIDERLYL